MVAELDLDRLAKVAALLRRGATSGERAAAEAAASRIAAAAGLTPDEALSKLDGAEKRRAERERQDEHPRRAYTWEEYAQEEVARAEAKWKAAVDRYGDPGDLFKETERERRLREALEPLERRRAYDLGEGSYVHGFDEWTSGPPTGRVLAAVAAAFPLPVSISDALAEWRSWEDLHRRRERYDTGDIPPHVRVRVAALESILDTLAAATWAEMDARLEWEHERLESGCDFRQYEERAACHERLKADLAQLRRQSVQSEQAAASSAPLTASERRRLVIEALGETPDASDRDIARRFGVSPTTVGTLRRKLAADDAPLFRKAAA